MIFITSSCQNTLWRFPSSEVKKIDIVFDLDYTIISKVEESYRGKKNVIAVGDELYRVHDWTQELMTVLHQNPRYRISFFSGGPEERNLAVLKQIKILDGSKKSLEDVAHKLLHRADLLDIEPPASILNPSPADRWKKDLKKINLDLNQIIMFEDDARHALNKKQRQNILWMGMSYLHFDTSEEVTLAQKLKPTNQFVPPGHGEWMLQRNKLALSYGILQDSVEEFDKGGGVLPHIVQKRLAKTQLTSNVLNEEGVRYFFKGSHQLKRINPKGKNIPLDLKCFDLMGPFFRQLAL